MPVFPLMYKKVVELLRDREFLNVASCDLANQPNAAPKFFLKIKNEFVYLIDYTWGRTWRNLKVNPRISLSFMDTDSLHGYQINGAADIVSDGEEYAEASAELERREIDLSARRIIEGVAREKKHGHYEVALPEKFVLLKVRIAEIVEIGPSGGLKRESI